MISGHKIDDKLIYTGHITSPHNIITRTELETHGWNA